MLFFYYVLWCKGRNYSGTVTPENTHRNTRNTHQIRYKRLKKRSI